MTKLETLLKGMSRAELLVLFKTRLWMIDERDIFGAKAAVLREKADELWTKYEALTDQAEEQRLLAQDLADKGDMKEYHDTMAKQWGLADDARACFNGWKQMTDKADALFKKTMGKNHAA